jgi:hypothetical protein
MGPRASLTQRLDEKSFASAGDRTPTAQSVVRPYTKLTRLLSINCSLFNINYSLLHFNTLTYCRPIRVLWDNVDAVCSRRL